MRGMILVDRSVLDHPIAGQSNDRIVMWIWMLCAARWKSQKIMVGGNEIGLKRGQLFASIRTISRETRVSKGVVERFIRDLKTGSAIETVNETGGTIITICNYDKYQRFDKYKETASETPNETGAGQKRDKDGTRAGHKRTTEETKETKVSSKVTDGDVVDILSSAVSPDVADAFVQHRRGMKKPMTPQAATAMLKKLDGHTDPDAVLNDSIANGWQGIFPEKVSGKKAGGSRDMPEHGDVIKAPNGRWREYVHGVGWCNLRPDEVKERGLE